MASQIILYTFGPMDKGVCDSVTSAAAGFPKENLVDLNPDTYWKPTSDANQDIDINLSSAKNCNAAILWINNYTTNFGSAAFISKSSPDDSVYTNRGGGALTTPNTPIWIDDFSGTYTFQFWRFSFSAFDPGDIIKISTIALAQKYTISQGNEWPENDVTRYFNRSYYSAGGRSFVASINSYKQEEFSRTYQLNESQMTSLKGAFDNAQGSRFPIVIQEGSTNADARMVRFAQDELDENQIDYQIYRPTVTFVTMPYIPDGSIL